MDKNWLSDVIVMSSAPLYDIFRLFSPSLLQVIVYRTEHEYHHHIPLATPDNFTDGASARSILRSEDERTSRGAESLVLDIHGKPEQQLQAGAGAEQQEKYVIDMLESDG